jgi:putative heme-binding domain-containing protein
MGFSRRGVLYNLASARGGDASTQEDILDFLKDRPALAGISADLKLLKLRVLEVSCARQGRPSEEWVKALMEELLAHYPVPPIPANAATPARNPAAGAPVDAPAWRLNRELCALLTWLSNPELGALNSELPAKPQSPANPQPEARPTQNNASAKSKDDTLPTEAPPVIAKTPNSGLGPVPNPGADIFPGRKGAAFHAELGRQVIEKTLALMDAAPSQEEQIHYAFCLRWAHGWTPEQRVRYFRWFHEKTVRYTGGNSFVKFAEAIRADAASRVPESERQPDSKLADWLRPLASPRPAVLRPRAFVKAWTLPELEAALDKLKDRKPDLARGMDLYTQAQCAQCHLFRDAGGNVGPDLTAVAQRFGRHDILESITDPSKVVSEQYAMVTLTILDGKGGTAQVSGLVKEETSATVTILTDPLAGKTSHFYKNVIMKREKAAVSIMPPGLLYTLTAEEVADLLALFGAK